MNRKADKAIKFVPARWASAGRPDAGAKSGGYTFKGMAMRIQFLLMILVRLHPASSLVHVAGLFAPHLKIEIEAIIVL
ncbi:hypothetical protein [Marinobacter daepoensis]|uniref:hypothetical protein n=1 Tax=Marinobacter daepoensis TaxID=262077 RepID=UPI0004A2E05F|nr:hypothetical protein [Marinobacter daepoensis]